MLKYLESIEIESILVCNARRTSRFEILPSFSWWTTMLREQAYQSLYLTKSNVSRECMSLTEEVRSTTARAKRGDKGLGDGGMVPGVR